MDYVHHYDSPLGGITIASDGVALVGLWFDGQKHLPDPFVPGALAEGSAESDPPVSAQTDAWLDTYFAGSDPGPTPPLAPRGTAFRREVWEILLQIPYGRTTTYGDIAARLARRRGLGHFSAQAVGGAVGHNPISVIIPCHRVLGSDGSLTGYAGGLERKAALLALERTGGMRSGAPLPELPSHGGAGRRELRASRRPR